MYPSDLTDEQWEMVKIFFRRPEARGAPEVHERRRIVEAILYRLREGCRWRALPADFPPWPTVSYHFQAWRRRGVWEEAARVLATAARQQKAGRARRAPRHAILDSQSVKSAAEGEERGFRGGKKIKGRSRHVAVDSQGSLLALKVTAANRSDSAEAGAVMAQAVENYPSLETFTADQGYKEQAADEVSWISGPPSSRNHVHEFQTKEALHPRVQSPGSGTASGRHAGPATGR